MTLIDSGLYIEQTSTKGSSKSLRSMEQKSTSTRESRPSTSRAASKSRSLQKPGRRTHSISWSAATASTPLRGERSSLISSQLLLPPIAHTERSSPISNQKRSSRQRTNRKIDHGCINGRQVIHDHLPHHRRKRFQPRALPPRRPSRRQIEEIDMKDSEKHTRTMTQESSASWI
jgi:hypothetical protein